MHQSDLHRLIVQKGQLISRSKGQVVQTSDVQKSLNLLKSGYIKRYIINNDGSLGVDLIYGPGDVFSLILVFKVLYDRNILKSPEVYYYQAMSSCELYSLNIDDLEKEVTKNPLLYRDLLDEAGKRLTSETQGLENLAMKSAYRRVAHRLAYYAERFGHKGIKGTKILPPLTHQDIADVLSLTRETVSVCMMKLRKKRLIAPGSQIFIPNIEKLKEEAFN